MGLLLPHIHYIDYKPKGDIRLNLLNVYMISAKLANETMELLLFFCRYVCVKVIAVYRAVMYRQ